MSHSAQRRSPLRLSALLVGTGLLATGCLGGGSAGEADDDATIRVQALAGPIIEAIEPIARAYEEENPGVTVQLESLSNDAARQPNVSTLTSSSAPDVGFTQIDSDVFQTLVESDDLRELDTVWDEAELWQRYPEAAHSGAVDNETPYATVLAYTLAPVVFYNAEMFDQLDIDLPDDRHLSNEEFLHIVEELHDEGVNGLGVGGNTPYHLHHLVAGLLAGAATEQQWEQYLSNWDGETELSVDYTTGPYMEAVETLAQWHTEGVFPDGVLNQDYTQAESNFAAGESGMFLGGTWTPGELEQDLSVEFEVDWFRVPPLSAETNDLQLFAGDMLVIPEAAGNPEGAEDFLQFAMSPEQQGSLIESGTLLPIVDDVPDEYTQQLNEVTASIVEEGEASGTIEMWGPTLPSEIGQEYGVQQYQSLLSGTKTAEEIAEEFDAELDGLRDE